MTTREKVIDICTGIYCTECPVYKARRRKDCLDWATPSCYEWAEGHSEEFTRMYIQEMAERKRRKTKNGEYDD